MVDYTEAFRSLGVQQDAATATATGAAAPAEDAPDQGYQDAFRVIGAQRAGLAKGALLDAAAADPEKAGRAEQLSAEVGAPAAVVEGNLPAYEQQAQLARSAALVDGNPVLGRWLASNPPAARIAKDDFDKLDLLSKSWAALSSGWSGAFAENRLARLYNTKQAGDLVGADLPATDKAIAEGEASMKAEADLGGAWGVAQKGTKFIAGVLDNFLQGQVEAAAGAVVGGVAGAAAGGVGAAPGAAAGYAAGEAYGFLADMARVAAGQNYRATELIRGANGEQLGEPARQLAALMTGVATYVVGGVGARALGNTAGEFMGKFASDAVTEAVARPGVARALGKAGAVLAKGGLEGAGIMGAMEAVNVVAEEFAKQVSAGDFATLFNSETTRAEAASRIASAAVVGAFTIGALHLPAGAAELVVGGMRARQATADMAAFKSLEEGAVTSNTRRRSLDAFTAFLRMQAEGSPVERLFIPGERVTELYQSLGIEPGPGDRLLGDIVPDLKAQLDQAKATGGDVVVPTADYIAHLAGTPAAERLREDIRVRPEGWSLREAAEYEKQRAQLLADNAVDFKTRMEHEIAAEAPVRAVYDDIFGKLRAAGHTVDAARQYAALYAAHYGARAERFEGRRGDAKALYDTEGVDVRRVLPRTLEHIPVDDTDMVLNAVRNGSKLPSDKELFGPSLLEFVQDRGGMRDESGELKAMDAHKFRVNAKGELTPLGKRAKSPLVLPALAEDNRGAALLPGEVEASSRNVTDRGLDDTALAAWERGYFPEHAERPDINDFLEAVRDELAGRRRFAGGTGDEQRAGFAAAVADLDQFLNQQGIDPATMSNAEIKARLREYQGEQMEGREFRQTDAPEFKEWFAKSKVVGPDGKPMIVYHGAAKPDRIAKAGGFKRERATSGPMSFFTDSAELASSYGTKKSDTSHVVEDYATEWTVNGVKGLREAFLAMPAAERVRLREEGWRVMHEETETGPDSYGLAPADARHGYVSKEHWAHTLRENRNNPLLALWDIWHNGGHLVQRPEEFRDVLKTLGIKDAEFDDPDASSPGVFPVYLKIEKPLDTAKVTKRVIRALEEAAEAPEAQPDNLKSTGDIWDKHSRDPHDWVAQLVEDVEKKNNSHVWTSIPDWVTATLRDLGYDGIKDTSGKMGGEGHEVWIPFDEEQVRSIFAAPKSLFQAGERPENVAAQSWAEEVKARLGLKEFAVWLSTRGDLHLTSVVVDAGERKAGKGTAAMEELTRYADENGLRVTLTPADETYKHGTTSRARLVKFYKRFGFVENKGRSKDFTLSESMYREPQGRSFKQGGNTAAEGQLDRLADLERERAAEGRGEKTAGSPASSFAGLARGEATPEAATAHADEAYPKIEAGAKVDGREVRDEVPNASSIAASLGDDYEALPGIREVPMSEFGGPRSFFYAADDFRRSERLAEEIKASREINPVIVVIDAEGPYILEGAHRMVALQQLKAKSVPALVVVDHGGFGGETYEQGERGKITLAQGRAVIELFKGADLSTFLHETGHLWLDELMRDAADARAPADLQKDAAIVLQWMKLNSSAEIGVEQHEAFARAFEAYLMEGRAPSTALGQAFAKFKAWLVRIYRDALNLKTPIDDRLRGVFDRLLATAQEIEQHRAADKLNPIFGTAADAGMTNAEFAAYTEGVAKARQSAEARLLKKVMAGVRAERTKAWAEEEAAVRGEVDKEVRARPDLKAEHWMRSGRMLDDPEAEPAVGRVKLNRAALGDMYGNDEAPGLLPAGTVADKGGVHPDEVAELFGYRSGDAMVKALMSLEAQRRDAEAITGKKLGGFKLVRQLVDDETRTRMLDRHGDALNDGSIEEEALAAVHNAAQADVMAMELRALARKAGADIPIALDDLKNWVRGEVSGMEVGRGVDQAHFARAEARSGRLAERALLKGDLRAAFAERQRQLVNHLFAIEAGLAKEEYEKGLRLFERYSAKPVFKAVEQAYTDRIHELLKRIGYDGKRSDAELRQGLDGKGLGEFVAEESAKGHDLGAVSSFLLDGTWRKEVDAMTVDEFMAVKDAIANLAHVGRSMKTIMDEGKRADLAALVEEAVDRLATMRQKKPPKDINPGTGPGVRGVLERMGAAIRATDAAMVKEEQVFDWLDGRDPNGVFNRVVFRRLKDAQHRMNDMLAGVVQKVRDIEAAMPKGWAKRLDDRMDIAELPDRQGGVTWRRKDVLAMALNVGNRGNAEKLAKGYRWRPETIKAVLDRVMRKEDWDFVQGVWDAFESLYPEIEAMTRRVTGVGPEKVDAVPVQTPFGEYRGGYFPVVYDPLKSSSAELRAQRAGAEMFENNYTRATTPKGHTITRVENYAAPIRLSLDVIPWKLGQAVHDLAFREAVIDADKFLTDKRIRAAVDGVLGHEYTVQFRKWLQSIANDRNIDDKAIAGIDGLLRTLRVNTVAVGIGFRISTMVKHGSTALFNSFGELGAQWMARGAAEVYGSPDKFRRSWEFITERSGEMKHRMDSIDRDVRESLRTLEGEHGWVATVERFGHYGVAMLDMGSALPTWMGAYRKALSEGQAEADSVYIADKAVRNAHGAQGVTDLAAAQRGSETFKLFTMFYGFFNHIYNRQRDTVRTAGQGVDKARAGDYAGARRDFGIVLARSFFYLIVPALVEAIVAEGAPEEEKGETWFGWAAKAIVGELPAGIPVVRDIAKFALNQLTEHPGHGYTLSPVSSAVETMVKSLVDISRAVGLSDKEVSGRWLQHAIQTPGYVFGLPTGQAGGTAQYLWDLMHGDEQAEGVFDFLKGLMYGPKPKH